MVGLDEIGDYIQGAEDIFESAVKFHREGNIEKAEETYRHVIEIDPGYTKAMFNLGSILDSKGQSKRAIGLYLKGLEITPEFIDAYYNLGNILYRSGLLSQAVIAYEEVLTHQPDNASVLNSVGSALLKLGKLEGAKESIEKAIKIKPDYALAYNNLCGTLKELNRYEEAETAILKAIELSPGNLAFIRNLGKTYREQAKIDKAMECSKEIAEAFSDHPLWSLAYLSECPIIVSSNDQINECKERLVQGLSDRSERVNISEHIDGIIDCDMRPSFYLNYYGFDTLEIKKKFANLFYTDNPKPARNKVAQIKVGMLAIENSKMLIKLMTGIFNLWESIQVEITILTTAKEVEELKKFITNERIKLVTLPDNFAYIIKEIKELDFDILHYCELGNTGVSYYLPFFNLAPIQSTSWGSADTTGIKEVDYFISSKWQEPENAQSLYSEKLILLDNIPAYLHPLSVEYNTMTREDFGLLEDDHIYAVPQSVFKMHPDFDEYMTRILRADPKGKILLFDHHTEYPGKVLRERFKANMPDVVDRIVILPRQEVEGYVSMLNFSDLLLDPIYFGGGITSMEALGFGVPIVTLPGTHLRGRSTYAFYKMMDMDDLIVSDIDQYVDIAVKLGTDKSYRKEISAKIMDKCSVIHKNEKVVKELENCFIAMAGGSI